MKKHLLTLFLLCLFSLASLNLNAQLYDVINFESPDSLLKIDTSIAGNIWQIGKPNKAFFDSAYSKPNAIVTDTIHYYPPNNFSAFTIKLIDSNWLYWPINFYYSEISFYHKFDTDSLKDGGYIEVSYDTGITWTNIVNDPFISSQTNFVYDQVHYTNPVISNGNAAFTGRSSGNYNYVELFIRWCPYLDLHLPVYFRFVFSSDSIQNNKAGWIIDDIMIANGICEGIEETSNIQGQILYPNPTHQSATLEYTLKNNETISIRLYDMQGKMIKTFVENQKQQAGKHQQSIALPETSGSYNVVISSEGGKRTVRIIR